MTEQTRIIDGKQYTYRNSFPRKVALQIAKELRERGLSIKLTKGLGEWADTDIWYRIK